MNQIESNVAGRSIHRWEMSVRFRAETLFINFGLYQQQQQQQHEAPANSNMMKKKWHLMCVRRTYTAHDNGSASEMRASDQLEFVFRLFSLSVLSICNFWI